MVDLKMQIERAEAVQKVWTQKAVSLGLITSRGEDATVVMMRIWERLLAAEARIAKLEAASARSA